MSDLKMVYIAVDNVCGHWVGACADMPERAQDTAKMVWDFIQNGFAVDHISLAQYHSEEMHRMCNCKRKKGKRGSV